MFFRYPVSVERRAWIMQNFRWALAEGLLTATTPLAAPGDLAHHLADLHGVPRGFGLSHPGSRYIKTPQP